MPAQRVAKLEALLARVQTRAAESRPRRGSPALNVAPALRARFDEDEVTGKVPAVTESPRVQPPQVVAVAAKSAPKIVAAPPASPVVQHVEPAPVARAAAIEAEAPSVVDPAPVIAHASPDPEIEVVPQVFAPPAAPAATQAPLDATPHGPPFHEPEVAPAKTASPAPVAVAKVAKPAVAKDGAAKDAAAKDAAAKPATKPAAAIVAAEPPARGRQFAVAILLMLWILVVAAIVGLFFMGRLPMLR